MNTDQQNDPYAHLKQAWEAGLRICCKTEPTLNWRQKGKQTGFMWTLEPSDYEIESLPADKWAAEKAAHAQGKRIECRYRSVQEKPWETTLIPSWLDEFEYRIAPYPAQTYHTHTVVQQRREEAAAINTAMNPAPAGKLTDEQLGNMAAIASGACDLISKPRATAFARTVREALWEYVQAWPHSGHGYGPFLKITEQQRCDFIRKWAKELTGSDNIGCCSIANAIGEFAAYGYELEEVKDDHK